MADHCYMQITCAACDAPRFKPLGFQIAEQEGALVVLEDFEANQAHEGSLPTDLVYEGHHDPGDGYDGAQFACDGQEFASMPSGLDGGFIVMLKDDGALEPEDLARWLKWVEVRKRVQILFETLRLQPHPEPTPLDLAPLLLRAGEAGNADQWLAEKLHQAAEAWVNDLTSKLPRELTDEEREQLIAAYKDGYFEPPQLSPSEPPAALQF